MSELTLLVGILLDLITAVMLGYVGYRVYLLPLPSATLRRSMWFWVGASVFMILDGGFGVLVLLVDVPLDVAFAVLIVRRLAFSGGWLAFGAWILTLNGSPHERHWWTYTFVLLGAIFIQTWLQGVAGYELRTWSIGITAENPTPVWVNVLFGVFLFGPTAWQSARLMSFYRHLAPLARYRALTIGGSALLFSILVVAGFINNEWFWYGLLENRSVFTVATGVLIAIRPPWLLRRKGVARMVTAREFPGAHQLRA